MERTTRAFSKEGAVEMEVVAAALQPRFAVAAGPEQTVSRTWLDTFDWRLHSAGISLDYVDGGPLILQLPDGSRLQAPLAGLKWPAQVYDLPAGLLRDSLAPIIAPRALVPVVTVLCAVQESRVLNADDKTVARLLTESVDDGTSQLRIQPLRGYDAAGDRITRLLARVDGLTAVTTTPYDLALTHASRSPVNGDGRTPQLRAETPAAVAVAEMLAGFAAAIEENVPGTIASIDTEFLHDLRVAVRRTRSILKLAGDVLPDERGRAVPAGVQMAGRSHDAGPRSRCVLARVRHHGCSTDVGSSTRPRPVPVVSGAAPRCRAAAAGARAAITAFRAADDRLARRAGPGERRPPRAVRRSRCWRASESRGPTRTRRGAVNESPRNRRATTCMHCASGARSCATCSRCSGRCAPRRPTVGLLKELKSLQDTLGDFQDGEVQREAVHEFAAAMMEQGAAPPETVLAMGEMAAQLDTHQLNARAALAGRLQPFLADENRALVKALVR